MNMNFDFRLPKFNGTYRISASGINQRLCVLGAGLALLLVTGCNPQVPPTVPTPPSLPPKPPRAETRAVQAAGLVGYDGDKVRSKVDGILDQNDARNQKLEEMTKDPAL